MRASGAAMGSFIFISAASWCVFLSFSRSPSLPYCYPAYQELMFSFVLRGESKSERGNLNAYQFRLLSKRI